jgi:uncharacterized membrane protein YfhO
MPEFLLLNDYAVKPSTLETLYALATTGVDFGKTVVLEEEPNPVPAASMPAGSRVAVSDRTTDGMTLHVEAAANTVLLILDSYSTGWRATAKPGSAQAEYRVMPADYTFMAIPLSAGVHDFRLEYSPKGWRYGRWISLASLAGYLAVAGWWLVRRRRATSAPAENR